MLTYSNKNIFIKAKSDGERYYYHFTVDDSIIGKEIVFILDDTEIDTLKTGIETIKEMTSLNLKGLK